MPDEKQWGYEPSGALICPNEWPNYYQTGKFQSPINILIHDCANRHSADHSTRSTCCAGGGGAACKQHTRSAASAPDQRQQQRAQALQPAIRRLAGGPAAAADDKPNNGGGGGGGGSSKPAGKSNSTRRNHQHTSSTSMKSYSGSHHPIQPKSERKAAKTLSTLLLVFIATWLPYNVLVLIKTLSGGEDQVPEKIWNFSYYLCYINSTINPLCYALCNAQFRRTYMRILKCKLSNEHNSKRRLVPLQSSRN